eukprot:403377524
MANPDSKASLNNNLEKRQGSQGYNQLLVSSFTDDYTKQTLLQKQNKLTFMNDKYSALESHYRQSLIDSVIARSPQEISNNITAMMVGGISGGGGTGGMNLNSQIMTSSQVIEKSWGSGNKRSESKIINSDIVPQRLSDFAKNNYLKETTDIVLQNAQTMASKDKDERFTNQLLIDQSQLMDSGVDMEIRQIQIYIKDNNLRAILNYNMSKQELIDLKLCSQLNILQAICFYNAETILLWLADALKEDEQAKRELAAYQEPFGGNQALHFAVINGNRKLIEIVLNEFQANPLGKTLQGLNVLHCAAQSDRGVLSLYYFIEIYHIDIESLDNFYCTPLHFAILNKQFKAVEALLGLGANPNSQIREGQSCLHLAVTKFIEETEDYEEPKRIIKELLFNGASRDTKNTQSNCLCFMTHRPLEKVQKSRKFMILILAFNLINFAIFLAYYLRFVFTTNTDERFDHHCAYINNCLGHRNHKYFIIFLFCIFIYFISSTTVCLASIAMYGDPPHNAWAVIVWIIRIYTIAINCLQFVPLGYQIYEQTKKLFKKEQFGDDESSRHQSRATSNMRSQIQGNAQSVLTYQSNLRKNESNNQENLLESQSKPNLSRKNSPRKQLLKKSTLQQSMTSQLSLINLERGRCYNFRQLFCYQPATQEQLKAFLFSSSERFSTFIIRQQNEEKKKGQFNLSKVDKNITSDKYDETSIL